MDPQELLNPHETENEEALHGQSEPQWTVPADQVCPPLTTTPEVARIYDIIHSTVYEELATWEKKRHNGE